MFWLVQKFAIFWYCLSNTSNLLLAKRLGWQSSYSLFRYLSNKRQLMADSGLKNKQKLQKVYIQDLPLLTIWPEEPQKKFLKNLIINFVVAGVISYLILSLH